MEAVFRARRTGITVLVLRSRHRVGTIPRRSAPMRRWRKAYLGAPDETGPNKNGQVGHG